MLLGIGMKTMNNEIRKLADAYYDHLAGVAPTSAHMRGDYRFADRFEHQSREAENADIAKRRQFSAAATEIDPEMLSPGAQITRDVLIYSASSSASLTEARLAELNADPVFGLHIAMDVTLPRLTVDTPELADAMISKLGNMATAIVEATERLR